MKVTIYDISFAFLLASSLMMMIFFYSAYTSPTKITNVDVNSIGESKIEMFVLFPLTIISWVFSIIFFIRARVQMEIHNEK